MTRVQADVDNTVKIGLSREQRDLLEIQHLALKQKPKVIKNEKEFNEIWQDEYEDQR